MSLKSYVSLASGSVYTDTSASRRRFSFDIRYMKICFCVFDSRSQIQTIGIEYHTLLRYFHIYQYIFSTRIDYIVDIIRNMFAKMSIVAIGSQALGIKWLYHNMSLCSIIQDRLVGEYHDDDDQGKELIL